MWEDFFLAQALNVSILNRNPDTLKALSSGFTFFETVRSLATLDLPFLLYARLGRLLGQKWLIPSYECDPETGRKDAVSSNDDSNELQSNSY